jgi:hypothetical protein
MCNFLKFKILVFLTSLKMDDLQNYALSYYTN